MGGGFYRLFFRDEIEVGLPHDVRRFNAEYFDVFPVDELEAPVCVLEGDERRQVVDDAPEALLAFA